MPATKNGEDVTIILPTDLRDILTWHVEDQLVADDPGDRKPRITRERMAKSDLLFPAGRTGSFLSTTALWKPFASVSPAMTRATGGSFTKTITPKGMRRTNKDLIARPASGTSSRWPCRTTWTTRCTPITRPSAGPR